jgi:penicillin-binding protein 1A
MSVRGSAEDGTYGGHPPDGYSTSPIPIARTGHWEWVEDDSYGGFQNGNGYGGYPPRRRRRFRWLRRLFTLFFGVLMLGVLGFGGLLLVTPSVSDAQAVARSFDKAHHAVYPGPPVPLRFAKSLTATEDHRFYSEPGIDPFGVARVAVGTATGRPDPGGSTLYQQLAKMLYASGGGFTSEAEEVGLGFKLYLTYPRALILQMYADVAYFGHGYYGLAAASCGYFGVHPAQLSWPQAAMLAGLVQGPSVDDPLLHYSIARGRESHVLGRLTALGTLTSAQATAAYAQPLQLIPGGGHCS